MKLDSYLTLYTKINSKEQKAMTLTVTQKNGKQCLGQILVYQ